MYDAVLVPTDGSPGAEDAVERALDLARTFDAAVHALYVVDTRSELPGLGEEERADLRRSAEKRGRDATEAVRERATDLGLDAAREVREGIPHREIREYVDELGVDLVVMGTRGRAAERTRLGSTAQRVVALADVPVLVAPHAGTFELPEAGDRSYDRVLIPTDGSDYAERATEHGLGIAERYGGEVHGVYVVDETLYLLEDAPRSIVGLLREGGENAVGDVAAAARERDLPATTEVLRGVPDEAILDYAEGIDADLVVMGTRGRGGASARLLGSVTARVVRRSSIPVLAVS